MAKDFKENLERHRGLGLSTEEVAFYDALAAKPEVLRAMGDQTLSPRRGPRLVGRGTERMRASTTVDWQHRELACPGPRTGVRAAMRLMIKRLLKKYKYPPDGQDDAVALVIAGGCFDLAQHMGAGGGVGGLKAGIR